MTLFRLTLVALALCLATASAAVAQPPAGVPGAANFPGAAQGSTRAESRAAARAACEEFRANFASNRQQFGKCIAAGARARRTRVTPREACGGLGLSRKREEGERRSDFNACVVAAAHGAREGEETTDAA